MHHLVRKSSIVNYKENTWLANLKKASLLVSMVFLLLSVPAFATDNSTLEQQKKQAQEQLNQKTSEKNTLVAQVNAFDNQISSMQQEINNTQAELDNLAQKITVTNVEIKRAEADIVQKKILLGEYIKTMYISGQTSQVELILTSNNFSEFIDQSEYLQTMQNSVQSAVGEIDNARVNLESEVKALKVSEAKAQSLKEGQLSKQGAIQNQKSLKDSLLATTKGDEQAYQGLIKKIEAEIYDNNVRTWSGNFTSQGHVNKGDIIGYIGNTGYSTGAHLHFEIRNSSKATLNPSSYIGNGYFIDPAPGVGINVPYGYSDAYFYGVFHTGIDKADGEAGTPIRAAADGEIVVRETGWGNTYYTTGEMVYGNYVMIRHTNGMYSLYGHMR